MRKTFAFAGIAGTLILLTTLLTSCEKEVNINLAPSEPQLVVEGAIETGTPPYVFLTNSLGYFNNIDLETLQNNFVHDAEVSVSDGLRTVQLKEYSIDSGANNNKFYFYTLDTASLGNLMLGEVEKSYKLTIKYNGKVYEAVTKIPNPTQLDSAISEPAPFSEGTIPRYVVKVFFKDPDTLGNHVRYFTQRKGEPFYPGRNSVYSDEIINGTQFQTSLPLGEPPGNLLPFDSTGIAKPGDTVMLKWCAIDKSVYDFYNTFEFAIATLGNPFSSPTRMTSNISNNAIGVWAGYGSVYKEVIIK